MLLLRGAGDLEISDLYYARFHGRSFLDCAVSLDCKAFLSSPECQLVLDRAWLGRALVQPPDDEDDDIGLGTPRKSSAAPAVTLGPLTRLATARREEPHLLAWRFIWPVVAGALLPFVALAPPQLLHEAVFTPLYAPAERYWTSALFFVAFVIVVFHIDACDEDCPSGAEVDGVLGFWLLGLLLMETQAAWQVAQHLMAQGRPFLPAIFHMHLYNRWKRLDLTGILLAIAAAATRISSRTTNPAPEASVRAVASLLLWMRLLTVLSVHWASGPLLASLRRMLVSDVSRYIIFQVLSVVTHSAAFVSIYADSDTVAGKYLGSPLDAVMTLSEQTLPIGDPRCGPLWMVIEESGNSGLGWAITGSFGLFSSLLLLNLLIGMLSHSYDSVKNQAQVEFAHGRAREVLHAAALPVVPAPLNLLQLPGAAIYFVCFQLFRCDRGGRKLGRQSSSDHSVYGGDATAQQTMDRVERYKLFTRAWEEVGAQAEGGDPWRGSVSKLLTQAEKREEQMLARLEAQEAMLRSILDGRAAAAAPAGTPAPAAKVDGAGPSPARPTEQLVSYPRTLLARPRILTDL